MSDRIWRPAFTAAGALLAAALVQVMLRRRAKSQDALIRAVLTRPLYRDTGPLGKICDTGPLPNLVPFSRPPRRESGPRHAAHGKRHALDGSR